MRFSKICCCALTLFVFLGSTVNAFTLPLAEHPLSLSEQESEYLSELKTLRVLTSPDSQPYCYQNVGISIDILDRLCEEAGIQLQLIAAESYPDALLRLEAGEADLSAVKITVEERTENFLPYLRVPIQFISHKDAALSEKAELNILQQTGTDFNYEDKYAFVNITTADSLQECLDAVRSRRADILFCDLYQLTVLSNRFSSMDLVMTNLPQREISVGFALGKNTDARLVSALEKTVNSFSTAEMNAELLQHSHYRDTSGRILDFVYRNPFEIICALASLFFVILITIFVYSRIRAGQRQELRGYEDSYRMLADTFGEAGMEYDFLSDRLTIFGDQCDRLDLPGTVETLHEALNEKALRISMTAQDLDAMLENNAPGRSYEAKLQCGMTSGDWNWFRMIYVVVCTSEARRRPIRLIGCLVNIEAEYQESERLLKIVRNDQLTGLLNRVAAEEQIQAVLGLDNVPSVLMFIDVDYFKHFNDQYGHTCGDAVLSELGAAMREVLPKDSVLCRWGGDEFLVYLKGSSAQPDCLRPQIQALQEKMRLFTYQDEALPVTLSIGVALSAPDVSFQQLFKQADETLYAVKNSGRNSFSITAAQADFSSGNE